MKRLTLNIMALLIMGVSNLSLFAARGKKNRPEWPCHQPKAPTKNVGKKEDAPPSTVSTVKSEQKEEDNSVPTTSALKSEQKEKEDEKPETETSPVIPNLKRDGFFYKLYKTITLDDITGIVDDGFIYIEKNPGALKTYEPQLVSNIEKAVNVCKQKTEANVEKNPTDMVISRHNTNVANIIYTEKLHSWLERAMKNKVELPKRTLLQIYTTMLSLNKYHDEELIATLRGITQRRKKHKDIIDKVREIAKNTFGVTEMREQFGYGSGLKYDSEEDPFVKIIPELSNVEILPLIVKIIALYKVKKGDFDKLMTEVRTKAYTPITRR